MDTENKTGTLYLCATPIGNLEDITLRVLRTLKEVDLIAAEDTRNSLKLLNHFEIKKPFTSYHEHNKVSKGPKLIEELLSGKDIALITDAGTPGISDPGEDLVKLCYEAGIHVTSLPGAAACITALTLSGQNTRRFAFEAFLPSDKKERNAILESLKTETRTIIIYEAPHRLRETLKELFNTLSDRDLTVCKELTKLHENAFKTTLSKAMEYYDANEPKGEFVLVIAGVDSKALEEEKRKSWEEMPVAEHVKLYEDRGFDRKEAMKLAAKDRGVSKRDIYNELLS
ncbi:MAG: 16S rRNA (cytidine(1402)-2'-O)-methyltransferase [Lachnospiraceae bacterium]|nr:16S rRNA (cytidine(1402)-2'-O)-methyltransferase [Lachnospiraceae bacterium]